MGDFPALKARKLYAILFREPLGYVVVRSKGSHKTMKAEGRPTLHLAFHSNADIAPGLVRSILVEDVGLDPEEALDLLA